jgi:hypothetical protein
MHLDQLLDADHGFDHPVPSAWSSTLTVASTGCGFPRAGALARDCRSERVRASSTWIGMVLDADRGFDRVRFSELVPWLGMHLDQLLDADRGFDRMRVSKSWCPCPRLWLRSRAGVHGMRLDQPLDADRDFDHPVPSAWSSTLTAASTGCGRPRPGSAWSSTPTAASIGCGFPSWCPPRGFPA